MFCNQNNMLHWPRVLEGAQTYIFSHSRICMSPSVSQQYVTLVSFFLFIFLLYSLCASFSVNVHEIFLLSATSHQSHLVMKEFVY